MFTLIALALLTSPTNEIVTLLGTYKVRYTSQPERIPLNEPFSLEVSLARADGGALGGERLSVDGRMPEHRHGMTTQPIVHDKGAGHFTVEGMLFHMPGRWELYFDISREGRTERARVVVVLE